MAGLNKYSLISSHQAGPFTNQNRIMDFLIPEGGVYDLSQTFIQLVTRCVTTSTDVHNMCLGNIISSITPKNVDLIRNCWLAGSKVGKLEDITRVNVLQSNLLELTKSTSEKLCMVDSIYQVRDYQENTLLSPWVEWHKDGSVASSYRDNYLRIPLSQLFSLGSNVIDTSKTGALTVHVELENLNFLTFYHVPLFHNGLREEGFMQDITSVTSQMTTEPWDAQAQTGIQYDSIEASPYFIGQKINIYWKRDGVAGSQLDAKITDIIYNVIAKTITLTTDFSFTFDVPDIYEEVVVTEVLPNADFASLSIAYGNLGVSEVVNGGKMAGDMLEYMTWTVEQYSNNANSLERIFEVEANAVNALLLFPDKNHQSSLLSVDTSINDYRVRIDNTDCYDRNIRVNYQEDPLAETEVLCHDPLHYDSINRTIMNCGLALKNLTFLNMRRDIVGTHRVSLEDRFNARDNALMMLACPLPLTTGSKKVQFSVSTKTGADNIKNVILYKQVLKSVKLM